jgi:hypothetical protein
MNEACAGQSDWDSMGREASHSGPDRRSTTRNIATPTFWRIMGHVMPEALFPAAPVPPRQPTGRSSNWTPWIISIVVIAVLCCGGCGAVAFLGVSSLHPSGATAPGDFPVYPGAKQQAGFGLRPNDRVGSVALVQWVTPDKGDQVVIFYRSELSRGPWRSFAERKVGTGVTEISVIHRSDQNQGRLQIQDSLTQTIIQLSVSSGDTLPSDASPLPAPR